MQATPSPIDWNRRALWLAGATIAWNVVEGLFAMGFGIAESSVALFGFGVDSWVEVGSAGVVYWKLTRVAGCATTARERERRATRWISGLFLVLAAATSFGSLAQLATAGHPDSSVPALVVSVVSLAFMGFLWQAKKAAALALDSRTLSMDAACSLACIQLSAVLFVGSLVYVAVPALWWADGVAALVLSGFIAKEGWEGWQAAKKADFAGGCGCGG
jgi:divalent metal cation (Fe/Co/Zn/Cd) transporter